MGSSFLPSEILAAFLLAQLESRQEIQGRRKQIWEFYDTHLADWAKEFNIQQPYIPVGCEQTYHMYYLLLTSLSERQAFIEYLKANGIMAVFHYIPLHNSPMGMSLGGKTGDCPVTEDLSDRLVRLPFFTGITDEEVARVVETIKEYRPA